MHYLFLASVSQVIQDARFHGSEYMTNREIAAASDFSRFDDARQMSGIFHDMVYFDEPRWFGSVLMTEQDYHRFRELYQQFAGALRPSRAGVRHA